MGVTVRQKTKGKGKPWWVFISHHGKRKSIKVGDKKAADKVASSVRRKLTEGALDIDTDKKPVQSFREYAKRWLEGEIKALRRFSTYESYGQKLSSISYRSLVIQLLMK
jgi:integrase